MEPVYYAKSKCEWCVKLTRHLTDGTRLLCPECERELVARNREWNERMLRYVDELEVVVDETAEDTAERFMSEFANRDATLDEFKRAVQAGVRSDCTNCDQLLAKISRKDNQWRARMAATRQKVNAAIAKRIPWLDVNVKVNLDLRE